MVADNANWIETGARASGTVNAVIWQMLEDLSRPWSATDTVPIVEVLEFRLRPGMQADEEFRYAMSLVKEAMESQNVPFNYTVNIVESDDGPPSAFIAIPHQSFAELDGGDPNGFQRMLIAAHGHAGMVQIADMFDENMRPTSRRFWILRPDLSHLP